MIAEIPHRLDNFGVVGGIGSETKKNTFNPRVASKHPSSLTFLLGIKLVKESVWYCLQSSQNRAQLQSPANIMQVEAFWAMYITFLRSFMNIPVTSAVFFHWGKKTLRLDFRKQLEGSNNFWEAAVLSNVVCFSNLTILIVFLYLNKD